MSGRAVLGPSPDHSAVQQSGTVQRGRSRVWAGNSAAQSGKWTPKDLRDGEFGCRKGFPRFPPLTPRLVADSSTTERTAHPRNWLLLPVRCLAQPDLSPSRAGPAHPPLCPLPATEGPALAAWLTPFLNFLSHLNACCWLPRAQAVRTAVRSADSSQRRLGSLGGFSHSGRKRLVSSSSGCGRPSDPVGFPVILQPTLPTRTSLVSSLTKLLLT